MPERYGAVIFDFFGTLTRAAQRGYRHDRVARTLDCDPAAFTAALDRSYPARIRGRYGDLPTSLARIAVEAGGNPSHDQLMAAAWFRIDAVRADIRLRDEAVPTLRTLRTMRIATAVISDCAHELPLIMPRLAVRPLLRTVVYSAKAGAAKPDRRLYELVCTRLRMPPERCLYIGDGGGRELSGARRAGMTAVRLAAPDLAGHLTFDAERDWAGPSIVNLTDVFDFPPPSSRSTPAAYWVDERQLIDRDA